MERSEAISNTDLSPCAAATNLEESSKTGGGISSSLQYYFQHVSWAARIAEATHQVQRELTKDLAGGISFSSRIHVGARNQFRNSCLGRTILVSCKGPSKNGASCLGFDGCFQNCPVNFHGISADYDRGSPFRQVLPFSPRPDNHITPSVNALRS